MSNTKFNYKLYYRSNLPHIQPIDAIFFITYCLEFSLPEYFYTEAFQRKKRFYTKYKNLPENKRKERESLFNKKQFVPEKFIIIHFSPQGPNNLFEIFGINHILYITA